jgi:hypothetical protein
MEIRDKGNIVTFSRDQSGALTYEPFIANDKKFKFIKPGDPVGMAKWGKFNTLSIIVGSGVTFSELVNGLTAHQKLLGSDQPFSDIRTEAIIWCDHMKRGIIDLSKNRHDPAFYLASLFIYRDGSHPFDWSEEMADEMIADWEAGHVSEQDLFFFALSQVPAWSAILSELREQAERSAARSLVDTILTRLKSTD